MLALGGFSAVPDMCWSLLNTEHDVNSIEWNNIEGWRRRPSPPRLAELKLRIRLD